MAARPQPFAACFELIRERLGPELHSLWFNAQTGRSNTILGPDFEHRCGPASVVERFVSAAVHYPPGAFGQNNLDLAQRIVEDLCRQIPEGARVAEFYSGVGAIGLSLASRAGTVSMNELGASSLQGLALGVAQLPPAVRERITVIPGAAGAAHQAAAGAEVVIANPPRKGLDPELTRQLAERAPERFLYVSCALDSLLEDAARLTAPGRLRLSALTAYNLLPFTSHVETVACFERA